MIKKETIEKKYRVGTQRIPDERKINTIISNSKKSKIDPYALMENEKIFA